MTSERFNQILESRAEQMREVLGAKAGEYAQDDDRLHNFRAAANAMDTTVPQALWGMFMKHFVSLQDMVLGKSEATKAKVDEKLGDMINYLVLLEAVFSEQGDELHETVSPEDLTNELHREYNRVREPGAKAEPTRWQDVAGEIKSMQDIIDKKTPITDAQWERVRRLGMDFGDPVEAYAGEVGVVWEGQRGAFRLHYPEVYRKVADTMIRDALSRVSKGDDQ